MIRPFLIPLLLGIALLGALLSPAPARADGRYASIIVDADSLDILHARQIDAPRHPASLTKIMTLHLVFDAVDRGELTLDTDVLVSKRAARTPPVKMGLKAGQRVSVDTLVQAVAVRSSNDAAVVLAEAVAGSEAEFAAAMTRKAAELGMRATVFRNSTGLPNAEQITTARDMAKLAEATFARFPQHYHYFGQTHFRGRASTNGLLSEPGVDGFKTGYTRASGYNLVISARREVAGQPRRLFAVVLGGASKGSRNQHMRDLVARGFDVMTTTQAASASRRTVRRQPVPTPQPVLAASNPPAGWAVEYGRFGGPAEAEISAEGLRRAIGAGRAQGRSGFVHGPDGRPRPVHRAKIVGLSVRQAREACERANAQTAGADCRVISGPLG